MADSSPKPYHHGNLREALLRAGERALEVGGPRELSLRELSRELGVSHTAPRRHFADKQQLLDALAVEGFEQLGVVLRDAVGDSSGKFMARLTKFGQAYVSFALTRPALVDLMFISKHRPDAPAELLETAARSFSPLYQIITEGQKIKEVIDGDPGLIGVVIFASLVGMIELSDNGKVKGQPIENLVGEFVERIVLGLRPRD